MPYTDPKKLKEYQAGYQVNYRAKNKAKILARDAAYREANRECIRLTNKNWAAANPAKVKESSHNCWVKHRAANTARTAAYYHNNKSEINTHKAQYRQQPLAKFKMYVRGAKLRGIVFDLTFEQFMTFWQKPCHYSGHTIATIGLDRVDNTKGYVVGNVVPCCTTCNRFKRKMDPMDYVAHCASVVNHFKLCKGAKK